jgi:hypothetical protein
MTPAALQARRGHIQATFDTLIQLLKNAEAKSIPGATAAYAVYGAAKLGLDIKPHFESLIWPIIQLKAKHLSSDELAQLAWGMQTLSVSDPKAWLTVLPLLRGRKFAADLIAVSKSWFDQSQCVTALKYDAIDSQKLLIETLPGLTAHGKEVAKIAEEVLVQLKNKQAS